MNGFALLWSKILDSSLWIKGSKETRLLWVAMLAMKDSQGEIHASLVGLADRAKISVDECRKSLKVLMSPDPDDTSGVENGVRVRQIEGGWEIVNHDLYRFTTEAKREFWRRNKAEYRARKAAMKKQEEAFEEGYGREYGKRRKDGAMGVRAARRLGAVAGGAQALKEGFAEQNAALGGEAGAK